MPPVLGFETAQDMLEGNTTRIGHGKVRTAYLVKYNERDLVVKTLRNTAEAKMRKARNKMHDAEVLSLDAVS